MNKILKASAVALIAITSLASFNTALAGCGADHKEQAAKSIYETAKDAGFTTLIAAVDAANLGETLTEGGPFTVFAPTDEAFAMLPEGALAGLLADKEALSNVLLFHVTSGGVLAEDVVKIDSAKMLNGSDAAIDTREGVKIAGVQIKQTDIIASNGVIHIIDAVMLPSND
jgi:uncharacterized surface protein with fasciclin (FAS1) repeats